MMTANEVLKAFWEAGEYWRRCMIGDEQDPRADFEAQLDRIVENRDVNTMAADYDEAILDGTFTFEQMEAFMTAWRKYRDAITHKPSD